MRTIPYSQIEKGLAAIAGIDSENILAHEKAQFAEFINDATRFVWDYYPWPESTRIEKRYFRPLWVENKSYEIGDEVFFNDKYYRKFANFNTSTSEYWADLQQWTDTDRDWFPYVSPNEGSVWHEIGDKFTAEEWKESGLYQLGSLVEYDKEIYLCIKNFNGGIMDVSLQYVNYSQNGINISDGSHWQKVDTTFERFIAFDQEDEEVIGTLFSVHTADPRYNSGPVLDWELGREGIYVDLPFETNHVWVRYREEPPVFSPQDTDKPLLNYLAPAIKAYAYRSFLISDGQNEKAASQEQGLDMLVREIDKLVHQHDRGIKGFKGVAI